MGVATCAACCRIPMNVMVAVLMSSRVLSDITEITLSRSTVLYIAQFVCEVKGHVVEIKFLSQVYLGSHLRNFLETAHHVPQWHLVQPMYVWLRSVINAGHFT